MRFKALPVTSFEDVTLDLEQLGPAIPAKGSVAISWAASSTATVTINHGLGHTPTWVSLSLLSSQAAYVQATSVTATSIVVTGTAAAAWTGSGTVFWAAT